MIVIASKVGRMANRLLLFSHFIGTAVEHGFRIVNPAFGSYAHYFPSTAGDLLCRFPKATEPVPPVGRWAREFLYYLTYSAGCALHLLKSHGHDVGLIRLRKNQTLDLDSAEFLSALQRHRTLLVQDWFFRSSINCEKHGNLIRSFFRPSEHHLARSRALVEPARRRDRLLVGVHLRQDDYATFKGGRFFYSHAQYRRVMEHVQAAFAPERTSFLICSDSPVPAGAFSGLDVLYGNGHELEDLYALAACDRIVGPPSTYNKWASFYGAVPRYEIFHPDDPVTPASFRVASRLVHDPFPADLTPLSTS